MLVDYKNISISHEDNLILDGVRFQAEEGKLIYIIGRVGSGKSSLMRTMYGDCAFKGDEATVLGYDMKRIKVRKLQELRRKIGIVFQDFQLLGDRTVEENLRFVLNATGWNKKDAANRIDEVLEIVGMSDKKLLMPNQLSGGEQQRVVIARALLNNPKLIIADEPTGNLDVETSHHIMRILTHMVEEGATVIMSTHNLSIIGHFPGQVYRCLDHRLTNISEEFNKPFEMDDASIMEMMDNAPADNTEEDMNGSMDTDVDEAISNEVEI